VWFLAENGRIRFFRPTVIASYALDELLWGDPHAPGHESRLAFGLTLTNVILHAACSVLVDVAAAAPYRATRLRFELDRPLPDAVLLKWEPPLDNWRAHP